MNMALHTRSPSYIKELVVHAPSHAATAWLRSAARSEAQVPLVCPRVRRNYGECGFSFAGSASWNKLSASTRLAPTLELFKSILKTELFRESWLISVSSYVAVFESVGCTCLNFSTMCRALELS